MGLEMREVLPSAYNTITSNRSIGYTMESAIADIIDNSISANATKIDILAPPDSGTIVCYICDNGTGMDLKELDNAMTFGGRDYIEHRKATDLGRYGLGLKTASLSQCLRFSVITKKAGKEVIGGCWDLDIIKKHNEWKYLVLSETECKKILENTPVKQYKSGTIIFWEKFDRIQDTSGEKKFVEFSKQLSKTQDHLELVFHRYLSGNDGIKKISMLSTQLQEETYKVLGIDDSVKLRFLPDETREYLSYHKTHLFNFIEVEQPLLQFVV